jgi:hypothetical protein
MNKNPGIFNLCTIVLAKFYRQLSRLKPDDNTQNLTPLNLHFQPGQHEIQQLTMLGEHLTPNTV